MSTVCNIAIWICVKCVVRVYPVQYCTPPAYAIPFSRAWQLSWLFPSLLIYPESRLKRNANCLGGALHLFIFLLFQLAALLLSFPVSFVAPSHLRKVQHSAPRGAAPPLPLPPCSSPPLPRNVPANSSFLPCCLCGSGPLGPDTVQSWGLSRPLPQQPSSCCSAQRLSWEPSSGPAGFICFTCSAFVPEQVGIIVVYQGVVLCIPECPVPVYAQITVRTS